MSGSGWPWVIASGAEALEALELNLAPGVPDPAERRYRVRLYFAEPAAAPGQRIFDVRIQGRTVVEALDIAATTGGTDRGLERVFTGVTVRDTLVIEMIPAAGADTLPPVLSGLDIALETGEPDQ